MDECQQCKYYLNGACHRYPPTTRDYNRGEFPSINPSNWCGEFQAQAIKGILGTSQNIPPANDNDDLEKKLDRTALKKAKNNRRQK